MSVDVGVTSLLIELSESLKLSKRSLREEEEMEIRRDLSRAPAAAALAAPVVFDGVTVTRDMLTEQSVGAICDLGQHFWRRVHLTRFSRLDELRGFEWAGQRHLPQSYAASLYAFAFTVRDWRHRPVPSIPASIWEQDDIAALHDAYIRCLKGDLHHREVKF